MDKLKKDLRKLVIKDMTLSGKLMYYTWCYIFRYREENNKLIIEGKINHYNPLAYLSLTFVLLINIFINIYEGIKEAINDNKDVLTKWRVVNYIHLKK